MSAKLHHLYRKLQDELGSRALALNLERGELTLDLMADDYVEVMHFLRHEPSCSFETLIDLCGVDYSERREASGYGARYGVVVHLLSLTHNWRLRVRVALEGGNESPRIDSLTAIWRSADWYEREAFDLLGIAFSGHEDLRRILTDYDFSGHPLRKDFPLSGHVEMRYHPEEQRLVYEPLDLPARNNVPLVMRDMGRGGVTGE